MGIHICVEAVLYIFFFSFSVETLDSIPPSLPAQITFRDIKPRLRKVLRLNVRLTWYLSFRTLKLAQPLVCL